MNRSNPTTLFFLSLIISIAAACSQNTKQANSGDSQSARANRFFERSFEVSLKRSPTFQTFLGKKEGLGQWDDISEEFQKAEFEIIQSELQYLKDSINYAALDEATKLSYDLFKQEKERQVLLYKYRHLSYPVNQMNGLHKEPALVLLNYHKIDSLPDAEAYLARIKKLPAFFDQVIASLKIREENNIVMPAYLFERVIGDCENLLNGYPLEETGDLNPVFSDFKTKIEDIGLSDEKKAELTANMEKALKDNFSQAYHTLINFLKEHQKKANDTVGIWQHAQGDEFYDVALFATNATSHTPEEIFRYGMSEVARIHGEMTKIMDTVGFEGALSEFFEYLETDPQFYFPDTEAGRQTYLDSATAIINAMRGRLDGLFTVMPKAEIVVKRVEPFQENSAGLAYYSMPAPDGSRPGVYYVNLRHMEDLPKYEIEALAYHEGIPGHHMQLAIAQELEIPEFRKYIRATSYVEGWGLYSEAIPKEIGCYEDPYADFGRLAMELFRACRLVVDVGIHHKKWTREEAIDFYRQNTATAETDIARMVDRHIVWPGQATAYKIGMQTIFDLRHKAEEMLGEQFDLREFHDVVISSGRVHLNILERLVDDYIREKSGDPLIAGETD